MKTLAQPMTKGPKAETFKFRLSTKQKRFWEDALRELHYDDLSSYIRYAVDRALAQDFRSKDPKWQAFLTAVQGKAEQILGAGLEDSLEDRMEAYRRVENHKKKAHKN